ncbi:MAG: ATP-dependent metallopeptidase FtsH/Yme1/Tma family protein [Eubacteriaceae bacterium]|jgi:cell division protease FtsH|nr:ATP-dependent metallopeptidase FtsH/Yme1/Tma family protein [Eubacteriaceae bacterium]
MKKNLRVLIFYMFVISGIMFILMTLNNVKARAEFIPYSQAIQHLEAENVDAMTIDKGKYIAVLKLKNGTDAKTYIPYTSFDELILKYIQPGGIKVNYIIPANNSWISTLLPLLLMVGVMVFVFYLLNQQSSGGGKVMGFGKSSAKMFTPGNKKVTFKDVAGADEEKEEMAEIVDFLKNPGKYEALGAEIPKGILMFGPPGTGKTLLARAVAGEADVPFFTVSGSEFVEMFVGVGASRVRDLFDTAKKNAPCIVFIDEIDAVGRQRGTGLGGGHDEREQTLNQLLVEMDGFGAHENIIIMAATNRPDVLDPALLRPGRFDRQIVINVPDVKGREEILQIYVRNKPIDESVDLKVIAKGTVGFTGADLENLVNEAALLAARRGKRAITDDEMEEAKKRILAGPEKKSRVVTEEDKEITAIHEVGHAVVMQVLENCDEVHEISIIPRGMAAGYTISLPENDAVHMKKQKLLDNIAGLLGGRAAEKVVLDDICTGATNDIERATELARRMVTEFGMSELLGPMTFGTDAQEVFIGRDFGRARNYSEEVAAAIDKEIRSIIDNAYERAQQIIIEHRAAFDRITKALLEKETLKGEEFRALFLEAEPLAQIEKKETE